jgi:bla regulator protein blaR1
LKEERLTSKGESMTHPFAQFDNTPNIRRVVASHWSSARGRLTLFLLCASLAWAQSSNGVSQRFEVASIKPSQPGVHGMIVNNGPQLGAGGRFNASNVTVKALIEQAYGLLDSQVSGGPGWIDTERYDLAAKADGSVNNDQLRAMLQTLLAERFNLKLRTDTKDLPGYALVVGKGGSKLHKSEAAESQMRMGRGQLAGQKVSPQMLAASLSRLLGRTVTNRTELSGDFDFNLAWTPDESQPNSPLGGFPLERSSNDVSGPSLFTAVQEQLGLRLDAQRVPTAVVVIEHVEKPTEN